MALLEKVKYRMIPFFPWVVYVCALFLYVNYNLQEKAFFLPPKSVTFLCLVLIGITIYWSLIRLLRWQTATAYLAYWLGIAFIGEWIYLSNNRFTHADDSAKVLESVPITISLNWLILLFAIYALSTYLHYHLNTSIRKRFVLGTRLVLDSVIFTTYMVLLDGIGNRATYWTWSKDASDYLVWGEVPIQIFREYFLGFMVLMLPIRWYETFKNAPNFKVFSPLVSYPLYFGWSLFAATTAWAFRKGFEDIGNVGIIVTAFLTIALIVKRLTLKK